VLQVENSSALAARRTQAERREDSERGLVHAAIAVAAEQGVSACTFEAIARQSGLSRGLVTQRFGSKQRLIEAVINLLGSRLEEMISENRIDEMTGLEALMTWMEVYLRGLSNKGDLRAYFMFLSAAVADATSLRAAFAAEHDRVKQRLAGLVERGQADGTVRRQIDATAAALMIGSLQLGLSMQLLVDPAMDLDPIRETTLATLRLSFATQALDILPPGAPR
jgi:AcrR family transcriptional regulator